MTKNIYIYEKLKSSKLDYLFNWASSASYFVPLDMKGCICHYVKWQTHPFISKMIILSISVEFRSKHRGYSAMSRNIWRLQSGVVPLSFIQIVRKQYVMILLHYISTCRLTVHFFARGRWWCGGEVIWLTGGRKLCKLWTYTDADQGEWNPWG